MDRDKLKADLLDKIADAIANEWSAKPGWHLHCAAAVITVLEDAGISLCQADAGAKGETVSATPLHSDIIAEAVRKVSWKPEAFNIRSDENGQIFVSADGQPIMDFPARTALELGEALVTLAANSQSQIEERSDTVTTENSESSLTHEPSPPQEKENA